MAGILERQRHSVSIVDGHLASEIGVQPHLLPPWRSVPVSEPEPEIAWLYACHFISIQEALSLACSITFSTSPRGHCLNLDVTRSSVLTPNTDARRSDQTPRNSQARTLLLTLPHPHDIAAPRQHSTQAHHLTFPKRNTRRKAHEPAAYDPSSLGSGLLRDVSRRVTPPTWTARVESRKGWCRGSGRERHAGARGWGLSCCGPFVTSGFVEFGMSLVGHGEVLRDLGDEADVSREV